MSGDLKVTYADLETAATAMDTASKDIAAAIGALMRDGALSPGDFSDKGAKFASWYATNMTSAQKAFAQSEHSFTEIGLGLRKAAGLYALVDALAAKKAQTSGGH